MVGGGLPRDARSVLGPVSSMLPSRRCPECGSRAVSTIEYQHPSWDVTRVILRCGECGTWRGHRIPTWAAAAVRRRIRWRLTRDRLAIAGALRRMEWTAAPAVVPRDRRTPDHEAR